MAQALQEASLGQFRRWLGVALLLLLWFAAQGAVPQQEQTRELLNRLVPELMQEHRVPGVSIALISNAQITWQKGFGVKEASTGTQVDEGTIFQAASMSKPLFASLVIKLADRGVISLDKPLVTYAKQLFPEDDNNLDLITSHHVLAHSSGLPAWRSGDGPLKTLFSPGKRYLYSGEGYYYLQSVVTKLIGQAQTNDCATYEAEVSVCASNFEELMRTNVLIPLGMTSSSYTWGPNIESKLARGHDQKSQPLPVRRPRLPDISRYGAAGALLTTPGDYAKFIVALMKSSSQPDSYLTKDRVQDMLKPRSTVQDGVWWGLGWGIEKIGEVTVISHGGDNAGFHCFAVWSLETKKGYVIMTNSDTGVPFIRTVLDKLRGYITNRN